MAVSPTYPGVYVKEIPSGTRTIIGVATSITAFVGRAWKGDVDKARTITSLADYERKYGGLWRKSTMSYAVAQFFSNAGTKVVIVRVGKDTPKAATIYLGSGAKLDAATEGTWGRNLKATVDNDPKDPSDTKLFNLTIVDDDELAEDGEKRGGSGATETYLNVSEDSSSSRYVKKILEEQSQQGTRAY